MSDKATLKAFFETNDFPTAAQFADWIDSYGNFIDDEAPQLNIVTVTEAQVLAWFTTPITVVPAQGVGKVVDVLSTVAKNIFDTTAYTVPFGSKLQYHETNLAGSLIASMTAGFVASGADLIEKAAPTALFATMLPNVDIVSAYTVGNPTLGDGEIEIHTAYSVRQF